MWIKALGSILMILGTSVGAGMLALPLVTAPAHFFWSFMLLIISWCLMTIGAFSLLEVNLWLSAQSNLISMARSTLGRFGAGGVWVVYLLLLYSLICAYLSGVSDIIQGLLSGAHIIIPQWVAIFLSFFILGFIVYRGIASVDNVNRLLMTAKLLAYVLLIYFLLPHGTRQQVFSGNFHWDQNILMVMLTSFGYAIILPSLRNYLDSRVGVLKVVVAVGSLLPLFIYALWIFVVQALIPRGGEQGLLGLQHAAQPNTALMNGITQLVQNPWVNSLTRFFIAICAVTSFLGVSIYISQNMPNAQVFLFYITSALRFGHGVIDALKKSNGT